MDRYVENVWIRPEGLLCSVACGGTKGSAGQLAETVFEDTHRGGHPYRATLGQRTLFTIVQIPEYGLPVQYEDFFNSLVGVNRFQVVGCYGYVVLEVHWSVSRHHIRVSQGCSHRNRNPSRSAVRRGVQAACGPIIELRYFTMAPATLT